MSANLMLKIIYSQRDRYPSGSKDILCQNKTTQNKVSKWKKKKKKCDIASILTQYSVRK